MDSKNPVVKLHLLKERVIIEDDIKDRSGYIGGSDVATIMGLNPWKSAYTLWAEKTGRIEPDNLDDVEAVWWGVQEEELIAKRFTMKTGLRVRKSNYAYQCLEYPYLKAHVDRISVNYNFGLECKTTSAYNKTDFENGEVPIMHWWQCQFYMAMTGYKYWYLATKRNNAEFHILKIERDNEGIRTMLEACADFWDHVTNDVPPEIDGSYSTTETLKEMYDVEATEYEPVDLNPVEAEINAIIGIKAQIKALETVKTKYENTIKALMQNQPYGESQGYKVSWKTNAKGGRIFRITERKEGAGNE